MTVTLDDFILNLLSNPALVITVILTLGTITVNGWTDAPNAIATCISTRSISPQGAIIMAAIFNFLGVFVMTTHNSKVAETIYNMVDFGGDAHYALIALCAAMFAIVVWATAAWWFGIPTSESHALIAGISGAAIALQGGIQGINFDEWVKVIYGLGLSLFLGFFRAGSLSRSWNTYSGVLTAERHTDSLKMLKYSVQQAWPLCTVPRTAKNSWVSLCWAYFSPGDRLPLQNS